MEATRTQVCECEFFNSAGSQPEEEDHLSGFKLRSVLWVNDLDCARASFAMIMKERGWKWFERAIFLTMTLTRNEMGMHPGLVCLMTGFAQK